MPNGPTAFQETLVPVAVWTVTTGARGITIGAIAIGTRGVLAVAIGTRGVLAVAIEIRPVVIAKEVFP